MTEDLTSAKASMAVAFSTLTATAAGVLEAMQPWLTALGTLSGGILSLVLAYVHLRRWRLERQKIQLELEALRAQVRAGGSF